MTDGNPVLERAANASAAAARPADRGPDVTSSRSGSALSWLASILLTLPAAWAYVLHYRAPAGMIPTGFIHGDMATYMAHAREYFDGGGLTYGNPYSPAYDTPAIYFQPWTLVLGVIWRVTQLDPGIIFVAFGAVSAVVCVRLAMELYREIIGLRTAPQWLGFIAFVWGGGVLVLAGFAFNTLTGDDSLGIFRFDSDGGWWFLNFGRNFIYPTEAFYHALFLGCVLTAIRRQYVPALLIAGTLSISHPFSGVQLLLILTTWCFVEWYFLRSREVPGSFVAMCVALLALHLAYYIGFLNLFPEHRSFAERWAQPWVYHAKNFGPAYLLVGGLTAWRMRQFERATTVLAVPFNRLLLAWFAVSFLLANHEFAMRPVQPLHFTRGYVWMPLFLLGAPVLVRLLTTLWASRSRVLGPALCVAVLGVFVADNAAWFASLRSPIGRYLTEDNRELLHWLARDEHRGSVILAEHGFVGYLAAVYTPLRAWHGHSFLTPFLRERWPAAAAYFQEGVFHDEWRTMPLLIVYTETSAVQPGEGIPAELNAALRFRNDSFTVVEVRPASGIVSGATAPSP
jgi:hypothetical protein